MRKYFLNFLIIFLAFVNFSFAQATNTNSAQTNLPPGCPYIFTHQLSVGSNSIDVKILQEILNSDRRTRIADTGPGSPGQESFYFGIGTREALKHLQALFIEYIGTADGKFSGKTIGVVNALCNPQKNSTKPDIKTVNKTPTDSIPPTISINTTNTTVTTPMRVTLTASEPIKKPANNSVICDNCSVSEIRKLSNTNYLLIINPSDNTHSVAVQIEASKIFDLAGNTNSDASNQIVFNQSIIQTVSNIINNTTDLIDSFLNPPKSNYTNTTANTTTDAVAPDETFPTPNPYESFSFYTGTQAQPGINSNTTIESGQSTTLNWEYHNLTANNSENKYASNVQYCTINGGELNNKQVLTTGSLTVKPLFTTKYTITCFDINNYKTQKSLYVDVLNDGPTTGKPLSITASSQEVSLGGIVKLFWSSPNGTLSNSSQCVLNGGPFQNTAVTMSMGILQGVNSTVQDRNNSSQTSNIQAQITKRTIFTVSCWNGTNMYSDSIGVKPVANSQYFNLSSVADFANYPNLKNIFAPNFIFSGNFINATQFQNFTLVLQDSNHKSVSLCDQNYTIDWGDGTEDTVGPGNANCSSGFLKHYFYKGGTYTVVIVGDDGKIYDILSKVEITGRGEDGTKVWDN